MAPRRRGKKNDGVGLTRKDAAMDAMLVIGFPRRLITKTITELLKIYGGNEGWIFIEMDSYKVLLEALLEKNDPEAGCSQDQDMGENSQRFSEAGSSSVPPPPVDEEVPPSKPPADDDVLDSESQTETVVDPPFAIPESEGNAFTSPAEEREREVGAAAAGLLEPVSNLNNTEAPCLDEEPTAPILSPAGCNSSTPLADESQVASPTDPVSNPVSPTPSVDEHPTTPVPSLGQCKVFTPPAEESKARDLPDPVPNRNDSIPPCSDEQPSPLRPSMSGNYKRRRRPPCHGFIRKKYGYYTEPTDLIELEPSELSEEVLKLLGRDTLKSKASL